LAVASGDDGVAFVRGLSADKVVDGHKEDVLAAARQFVPNGLDFERTGVDKAVDLV
jgi:NADPH2:quinone reductase